MATATIPGPSRRYEKEIFLPNGTKVIEQHSVTSVRIVGYATNEAAQAAIIAAAGPGVTASSDRDGVFYAVNIETDVVGDAFANVHVVTFNSQGGTDPDPASKTVTYGQQYGALATTTRVDYVFSGWYTEVSGGGSLITSTSMVDLTEDITLYAKWVAA